MPLSRLVEPSFAPFVLVDTPPDGPFPRLAARFLAAEVDDRPSALIFDIPTTFTEEYR